MKKVIRYLFLHELKNVITKNVNYKLVAKYKCNCGKVAVWSYMPGFGNGANPHFCDDCVSSVNDEPCSCNHHYIEGEMAEQPEGVEGVYWKWVEEGKIWVNLDAKKRPYPCAEYDYDEDGLDMPNLWDKI